MNTLKLRQAEEHSGEKYLNWQCHLSWALLLVLAPVLMAGCSGGAANPAAAPVAAVALHSTTAGTAPVGVPNEPVAIPSSGQVVSARPITGDVGPTGNITISVNFPSQTVQSKAPVQYLRLVPAEGSIANETLSSEAVPQGSPAGDVAVSPPGQKTT